MESKLSAAGVLLASIGVLASGVGYVLRQYNEDRRIARTVLFNLLSIWEVSVTISIPPDRLADDALSEYKAAASELLGEDLANKAEWQDVDFESTIKPLLIQLILANRPALNDGIRENYLSSLAKLAERSPIISYKLTGREKIQELFSAVNEYEEGVASALEQTVSNGNLHAVLKTAQQLAWASAIKQLNEDIEEDILQVAWVAGIGNWIRCRKIVRNIKKREKIYNEFRTEMRQKFISLLRQLVAAHPQKSADVAAKKHESASSHLNHLDAQ